MRSEEKVIQEKRTIQATGENMMGPAGKIGVIARYLGEVILGQGSSLVDRNFLYDPFEEEEELNEDIKSLDGSEEPHHLGWVFDGLRFGVHMEVQLFNENNKIVVYYKGYKVYHEEYGELLTYAPFPEWIKKLDGLYKIAEKREEQSKGNVGEEIRTQIEKEKKSFFQKLRLKWGM